jgi:uncharacterized protein YkwD
MLAGEYRGEAVMSHMVDRARRCAAGCSMALLGVAALAPAVAQATSQLGAFAPQMGSASSHAAKLGAGDGRVTNAAQPAISTQASANIALGQGTLTDFAIVSGLVNPVTGPGAGTVTFLLYGPDDASCATPIETYAGVALALSGSQGTALSPAFTPIAPGSYSWRAFYSGDVNNLGVAGACNAPNESTSVGFAQPTITTQASPSVALGGGVLSDVATVNGLVNPVMSAAAGKVTFRVYGPNDATCAAPAMTFSDVGIVLDDAHTHGTATSPSFTPAFVGTYRWRAFYSGDTRNAAVAGPCNAPDESTVVTVPQSSIETIASPGVVLGAGSLTDRATVSGLVGANAGTVEFRVYGPDDASCATLVESFSGVALTMDASQTTGAATSAAYTPRAAGTYRWRAFYSGDASNLPASGPCNAPNESATVTAPQSPPPPPPSPSRGTPAISTLASPGIVLGGSISDTATVTGRIAPVAGSTVEFRLFGPDDATCASAPAFTSKVALSSDGTATSASFAPGRAGTYRWRAFYSGDANNDAVSGRCDAPGERVVVSPPDGPQITSAELTASPRVGAPARLVVTASDDMRPIAGMRVRLDEPLGALAVSGCAAPTLALPRPVVSQQILYTFRRAGRHVIEVTVFSGECSGKQFRTTTTFEVTVEPRAVSRAVVRAAVPPAATAAGCADRLLTATKANRARVAAAVLCLVNVERRKRGRKRLVRAPRLTLAAQRHSTDIFGRVYFAHAHALRGPSLVTRLRRAGFRGPTYAENIGYAADGTATRIVQAWMNSPPLRANILHLRLSYAGVGVALGIPTAPPRPGATFTMDLGGTLR